MDMQEKITARREQIDSLQGKIQHLEETMEKLYQVKTWMYQSCCVCVIKLNVDVLTWTVYAVYVAQITFI